MTEPTIAHHKGFYHEVKAGERYLWCRCGLSANQPFCDGSHADGDFLPVPFKAQVDEDVIFCGCKHTGTPPFCDGSHSNLPGGYRLDDPSSAVNQAVAEATRRSGPRVRLDGDAYVFSTARAELERQGSFAYCPVISPAMGALFQSQFYAEVGRGVSPPISADGRHTVLFVGHGDGSAEICGRRFDLESGDGLYVRPGESWRIHNTGPEPMRLFISQGPGAEDLVFLEAMPDGFETEFPDRRAQTDPNQRQAMGERFFQILVGRAHGSTVMTQFIGHIPPSKAEPHRHLYEEALIFLKGDGVVWSERVKAKVGAGDVLFLPRKLVHSVQSVSGEGMLVVGVIYPGDNPAISY